jgi:hypothetical protein
MSQRQTTYLEVISQFTVSANGQSRSAIRRHGSSAQTSGILRRRRESLSGRKTTVEPLEVGLPRNVNRFRVLFPVSVHPLKSRQISQISFTSFPGLELTLQRSRRWCRWRRHRWWIPAKRTTSQVQRQRERFFVKPWLRTLRPLTVSM